MIVAIDAAPATRAVGVASSGDQDCNLFSAFRRIDSVLQFVDAAIGAACHDGDSCDGVFRNGIEPPL